MYTSSLIELFLYFCRILAYLPYSQMPNNRHPCFRFGHFLKPNSSYWHPQIRILACEKLVNSWHNLCFPKKHIKLWFYQFVVSQFISPDGYCVYKWVETSLFIEKLYFYVPKSPPIMGPRLWVLRKMWTPFYYTPISLGI